MCNTFEWDVCKGTCLEFAQHIATLDLNRDGIMGTERVLVVARWEEGLGKCVKGEDIKKYK